MIILDSDHVSVLGEQRHGKRESLISRLKSSGELIVVSIVTVEEHFRGWMAQIHRVRDPHGRVVPYLRLAKFIDYLRTWNIVNWNEPAADEFIRLRAARIRIGTQDLQIAAIALANDALLLSANLRDFERVPGLRIEDWLYS